LSIKLDYDGTYDFQKFDIFIDNIYIGSSNSTVFTLIPNENDISDGNHTLRTLVYDTIYNKQELSIEFEVD